MCSWLVAPLAGNQLIHRSLGEARGSSVLVGKASESTSPAQRPVGEPQSLAAVPLRREQSKHVVEHATAAGTPALQVARCVMGKDLSPPPSPHHLSVFGVPFV